MKYIFSSVITGSILFVGALGFALPAYASVPPYLILSPTGSGDNVQINVTGDPNVSVLLSYLSSGSGSQIISLGTTNSSGSFTTTVSSATYGLTSGALVTAILNGTSGLKSQTVAWPTVTSTSSITLNQSAVVVNVGSSVSLTASNLISSATLYVSNNSNSSIANVSISGNSITISGNTSGMTNVTICQVGNTNNCPTVSVLVQPSGSAALTFSQTNPSVVSGQNLPITVTGGNGVYQIISNSDASTIQASINGSVLTLTTGVTKGSSSITVCTSDRALCSVLVATAGSASTVSISFSSNAPTVTTGGSTTVNVYGPTGVQFYVSSNANPSVVQANLSGTTLTLTGITEGTSSISVCSTTSTCASLTVTVQAAITGGNIALSQNAVSVLAGQTLTITVSGGTPPYSIMGGTSAVSQETLNGGALAVYGVASGVSTVNVCSAAGGCVLLTVTVNGPTAAVTTPVVTTPIIATPAPVAPAAPVIIATPAYVFTESLAPGSEGPEVLNLQKLLATKGYLSATPNGYYGVQTKAAVTKFQAAHGVSQLGIVGPSTRAALNQLASASTAATSASATIATMSLAELRAEVQQLQAALTQALNRITQLTGQ